jgi:hypothetical protein
MSASRCKSGQFKPIRIQRLMKNRRKALATIHGDGQIRNGETMKTVSSYARW